MMAGWHGVDPSGPASRMEELLPLLRRLWRLHEGPVRHDGRFYHVDVTPTAEMTPPVRVDIPLFTAGVNTRMVEVAAGSRTVSSAIRCSAPATTTTWCARPSRPGRRRQAVTPAAFESPAW